MTGSSRRGRAGVSFLIATVGSTFTSPTVVLVNTRVFGDDTRAVLLAQVNSWVDASDAKRILQDRCRGCPQKRTRTMRMVDSSSSVEVCVSDAVGEALLERALASRVAEADARESRCLRWK